MQRFILQPHYLSCPKDACQALQTSIEHKQVARSVSALCNAIAFIFQGKRREKKNMKQYQIKKKKEKINKSEPEEQKPPAEKKIHIFSKLSTILSKLSDHHYIYTAYSKPN